MNEKRIQLVGGIPEVCSDTSPHKSHIYGPVDSNYATACPGVKESMLMGIAFTETHDCHQVGGICNFVCCPISASAPVDICPKTHRVVER